MIKELIKHQITEIIERLGSTNFIFFEVCISLNHVYSAMSNVYDTRSVTEITYRSQEQICGRYNSSFLICSSNIDLYLINK